MSFNRLLILIGIVVMLLTCGVMWYWQYVCTPEARARTIFTQVRGDTAGLRAWMLKHGLIREEVSPDDARNWPIVTRSVRPQETTVTWYLSNEGHIFERFVQLGPRAVPVVMGELSNANTSAREVAIIAAGRLCGPQAVEAIVPLLTDKDLEVRLVACYARSACARPVPSRRRSPRPATKKTLASNTRGSWSLATATKPKPCLP